MRRKNTKGMKMITTFYIEPEVQGLLDEYRDKHGDFNRTTLINESIRCYMLPPTEVDVLRKKKFLVEEKLNNLLEVLG